MCEIPTAYLYYAQTARRTEVLMDEVLREMVKLMAEEMHTLYHRGYTPRPKQGKRCKSCSLADLCLPKLEKTLSVNTYMKKILQGDDES